MTPDVFMIAYDEPNAAEHWARLQVIRPDARLVEGVVGIRGAYLACAEAASTPYFFAVDADNFVLESFGFALTFEPRYFEIAIWKARNPVNGLAYGNGGIKLYPTELLKRSTRGQGLDITMSWAPKYRYLDIVASEHRFNTDPRKTWSAAFRECVHLTHSLADAGGNMTLQRRLDAWCQIGEDAPFGRWSIAGATDGRAFATEFAANRARLKQINDFDWLREEFARRYGDGSVEPRIEPA